VPSLLCYHCSAIKRCRMIRGLYGIEYVCKRCARELGYVPQSTASTPKTSISRPQAAKLALRGQETRP